MNYNGLKKQPTYNELINYIGEKQEKIKYPNRDATFIRNSPYLSQFDGDSVLDLQEQENKINKKKLMEIEIKKLASDTHDTAQALRINRKHMKIQTGGIRNPSQSSSGAQTEVFFAEAGTSPRGQPETNSRGVGNKKNGDMQTDDMPETRSRSAGKKYRSGYMQTDAMPETASRKVGNKRNSVMQADAQPETRSIAIPLIEQFNMAEDEAEDIMKTVEKTQEEAEKQKEENIDKIVRAVERNLGHTVPNLPYVQSSSSSSSSHMTPVKPKEDDKAEDTTRPRGRPPKSDKPIRINDGSENTTPMVVNREGEQQKRTTNEPPATPPKPKRKKEKNEASPIPKAAPKPKAEPKSEPKASAASSSSVAPPKKTIDKEYKAPSSMNMQNLRDILEHAYNNKALSSENMKSYKEAKDKLMKNKSDKTIKAQTLLLYRSIYKADIYKK